MISVSILVLLDVTLQLWPASICGMTCEVSILVLLDVTLQLGHSPSNRRRKGTFQSLFYWMLLFNKNCLNSDFVGTRFNPCFTGCYSSTCGEIGITRYKFCFNPCFTGCYSSTTNFIAPNGLSQCFNPCFTGCYSSTLQHMNMITK